MDSQCKRCSTCGISYPWGHKDECEVCGDKLDPIGNAGPDDDWKERVRYAQTPDVLRGSGSTERMIFRYRRRTLRQAGYGAAAAATLADAGEVVDGSTMLADLHQLCEAKAAGIDDDTALAIWT